MFFVTKSNLNVIKSMGYRCTDSARGIGIITDYKELYRTLGTKWNGKRGQKCLEKDQVVNEYTNEVWRKVISCNCAGSKCENIKLIRQQLKIIALIVCSTNILRILLTINGLNTVSQILLLPSCLQLCTLSVTVISAKYQSKSEHLSRPNAWAQLSFSREVYIQYLFVSHQPRVMQCGHTKAGPACSSNLIMDDQVLNEPFYCWRPKPAGCITDCDETNVNREITIHQS